MSILDPMHAPSPGLLAQYTKAYKEMQVVEDLLDELLEEGAEDSSDYRITDDKHDKLIEKCTTIWKAMSPVQQEEARELVGGPP